MHSLYYLSVAGQTYEVDSTTYNAAPDAGIVSLYVLPRSRAIVNLERMPDRPLPAGVTTSPAAVMGVAMAALNPFDSVKSAEARAEIAAIGNAMQAQMAGAATPAQIGALLMGLRVRGETVEEIAGAASSMRRHALFVDPRGLPVVGADGLVGGTEMTARGREEA